MDLAGFSTLKPPPPVRVRPAREDDLERLVSIHLAAFPDVRSRDARRRNFTDNTRGALGDLLVVETHGEVVGHAFAFPLGTWVGGTSIPLGGVASVGIAPHARGRGLARVLLDTVDEVLRGRSAPLAMLYPFKHAYYKRLGYGLVSELRRLRFAPSALPAFDAVADVPVRPMRDAAEAAAIRRIYERAAIRANGMVLRREGVWRSAFSVEGRQWFVVPGAGQELEGYVAWGYLSPPEGLPLELEVLELVTETDRARGALLRLLRTQRDQVPCVRHVVHAQDPLLHVLSEPRVLDGATMRALVPVAGEVGAGPMLKLVDVPRALASRGYAADGDVTFRVTNPEGTRVTAAHVHARDGKAHVEAPRTQAAPSAKPWIHTDASTAAQLYTSSLRATDAVRYGIAHVDAWETALQVDRMLAAPPFFPLDVF